MIGAPIDCEATTGGCTLAPVILRQLGLYEAIGATHDFNDMPVRILDATRDPATGIVDFPSIERLTRETRDQVGKIVKEGYIPVVLGGCCSMVMGAVAGTKDVYDRIAVVYVDGQLDMYTGKTSLEGLCADMPSAILLGYGPPQLAGAMGAQALLAPDELILLAYRDEDLARSDGSLMPGEFGGRLRHCCVHELRSRGAHNVAEEQLNFLNSTHQRFWLHIDWDVLDEKVFPSADFLMPNGLTWTEFDALVRPFVQSEALVGVSMSDYNPENDPGFHDGKKIVKALKRVFLTEHNFVSEEA